jgi:uncharacterized protein (DUF2336 family)
MRMSSKALTLIAELDAALGQAPSARQSKILHRITDLFLSDTMSYSDEQVSIFDDVFQRLIERVDNPSLVTLSTRLAPVENGPPNVIATLAQNDDIAISEPVLTLSPVLTDQVIAKVAGSAKGPRHLAAIAARVRISEAVTDALIDRGVPEMINKVIANPVARISEIGFVKLINRAKGDKALATAIAARGDLPAELMPFLKLALG